MKIIIVRYPYEDYEVGEVADFGDEVNASLVEFQRAVWAEEPKPKNPTLHKASRGEETEAEAQEGVEEVRGEVGNEIKPLIKKRAKRERMLKNELGEKIEEKKKESSRGSFWDKLK